MSESEWITAGYADYLKKRKRKHSRDLFQRYLEKCFLARGVDLRYPSCMPRVMNEMFWQTECLKTGISDLIHVIAVRSVGEIEGRKHIIEKLKKIEGLYDAIERIFSVDRREGCEANASKVHPRKVQKSGLARSVLRARIPTPTSVNRARRNKKIYIRGKK